jgi:hypothetical protein
MIKAGMDEAENHGEAQLCPMRDMAFKFLMPSSYQHVEVSKVLVKPSLSLSYTLSLSLAARILEALVGSISSPFWISIPRAYGSCEKRILFEGLCSCVCVFGFECVQVGRLADCS